MNQRGRDILEIFAEAQQSVDLAVTSRHDRDGLVTDYMTIFNPKKLAEKSRKRRSNKLEKYRASARARYRNNPIRRLSITIYASSERRKEMDRLRYLRRKDSNVSNVKDTEEKSPL